MQELMISFTFFFISASSQIKSLLQLSKIFFRANNEQPSEMLFSFVTAPYSSTMGKKSWMETRDNDIVGKYWKDGKRFCYLSGRSLWEKIKRKSTFYEVYWRARSVASNWIIVSAYMRSVFRPKRQSFSISRSKFHVELVAGERKFKRQAIVSCWVISLN